MLPTWPAAKILWLARHEPDTFARTAQFLLLEDYFIASSPGRPLRGLAGHLDLLLGLPVEAVVAGDADGARPRRRSAAAPVGAGHPAGPLLPAVATELGLAPATLVCAGALDQACGAIGVGNVRPGILSENTGTAVALCATLDGPRLDPPCACRATTTACRTRTCSTPSPAAAWSCAGSGTSSARPTSRPPRPAPGPTLTTSSPKRAASVPPAPHGLVVLPHLQGAMAPDANPRRPAASSSAWRCTTAAITSRGRCWSRSPSSSGAISRCWRNSASGLTPSARRGGGARSRVWKQIEADVTGSEVRIPISRGGHPGRVHPGRQRSGPVRRASPRRPTGWSP